MVLWFVATSVLAVRYVFRDPRFDYRLLIVGALLPDAIDLVFGGARVLHTLTASVALMTLIMVATRRGSALRRRTLPQVGPLVARLMELLKVGASDALTH